MRPHENDILQQLERAAVGSELHPERYEYRYAITLPQMPFIQTIAPLLDPRNFFTKVVGGHIGPVQQLFKPFSGYGELPYKVTQTEQAGRASLVYQSKKTVLLGFMIEFIAQKSSRGKVEISVRAVAFLLGCGLGRAGISFFLNPVDVTIKNELRNMVATGVGNWVRQAAQIKIDATRSATRPDNLNAFDHQDESAVTRATLPRRI